MSQDQKNMSWQILEMWGSNNSINPDDLITSDYVNHQLPDAKGGISTMNPEEWKALLVEFHEAFTDAKAKIYEQVAENNLVASRWEFMATQVKDFKGIPSKGKTTNWRGVQIDRHAGGKIAESWVSWDKFSFLEGLGQIN